MDSTMTYRSRHVSVSIKSSPDRVYEFVSNPSNLPKWAAGLSGSIEEIEGDLIAESPMGRVKIKFASDNTFGILDHYVMLPSGEIIYNPMRVFQNENGSELVFTLYQRPGMSDQNFRHDEELVASDLQRLKSLIGK